MKNDIDLSTLSVQQLIAHDIPKRLRSEELVELELSQAIAPLPPATLNFFAHRVQRSLLKRGQQVEIDARLESRPVPDGISALLTSQQPSLVDISQTAARHLYQSQTGAMSEGLLVVCDVVVEGRHAIALLKLEREEGVLFEHQKIDGRPTLMVTVLSDLTLTDNTRVFKAGLFWRSDEHLIGLVSDEQQGDATDIAGYFLTTFLGCRLRRRPAVVTRAFHDAVSAYINNNVTDPKQKLDYSAALHAEIASNRSYIDPQQFINDYFAVEHREPLRQAIVMSDVPEQAFRKDAARLGSRATRSSLKTAGGLTISGASEAVEERVSTEKRDHRDVIVVQDTIVKVV